MSDGLNEYRQHRVLQLLGDFTNIQVFITSVPAEPENPEDRNTEGWAALRQCYIDGQQILQAGMDFTVPTSSGGTDEQDKAELKKCYLDAYARRHVARKIYLRQEACMRWVQWREQVLNGGRPHSGNHSQLRALDHQLRAELGTISDESVYNMLRNEDFGMERWIDEDPSLRAVTRWIRTQIQQ
ncbi:hypothetical protein QBC47DRAFT_443449 [Echria macrotheca]|uniref:Uncharacterized protein n=1 Tax=Echria macrotheca TaxID=438768 RepID=A0AAJ0BEI2_9PEZI|nr:hypothetical protein QBC47DRAFT_443449 [Echria macrotheca]